MNTLRPASLLAIFAILFFVGCTSDPQTSDEDRDSGTIDHQDDTYDAKDDARNDTDDADIDHDGDPGDTDDTDDSGDTDDAGPTGDPEWSCNPDFDEYVHSPDYNGLEFLSDQDLINELHLLVDNHTSYSYRDARDFLYGITGEIDVDENGEIECVYTGRRVEADDTRTPGMPQFNTEHSWPRYDDADFYPAESDLHHLFPVDMESNTRRGHHEFGNVSCSPNNCTWGNGGAFLGPSADDPRNPVFEVRPEGRGNIARAHFYFSVRYSLSIGAEEEAVLRQWHCEDPPDDIERARNDGIFAVQNNRNPFVDRPDLVDRIANF